LISIKELMQLHLEQLRQRVACATCGKIVTLRTLKYSHRCRTLEAAIKQAQEAVEQRNAAPAESPASWSDEDPVLAVQSEEGRNRFGMGGVGGTGVKGGTFEREDPRATGIEEGQTLFGVNPSWRLGGVPESLSWAFKTRP
jgi:hypothetical protein